MNERIQELKKQAWEYAMAVHDGHIVPPLDKEVWPTDNVFDEKFAELIVRECSNHIRNRAMRAGGACTIVGEEGLWLAKDVEEHFGVEE